MSGLETHFFHVASVTWPDGEACRRNFREKKLLAFTFAYALIHFEYFSFSLVFDFLNECVVFTKRPSRGWSSYHYSEQKSWRNCIYWMSV